jgi:hypothetical protein
MHDDILEKVIRYAPEAEATLGGIPKVNKIGLNTTPPPSPKAPATNPPKKPSIKSYTNTSPIGYISEAT